MSAVPVSIYRLTPLTGFTNTIPSYPNASVIYAYLTPAGTLASGTLTTPTYPEHGQALVIMSTQIVTALTLTANTGQTVLAAPTALAVNTPVTWYYDGVTQTWLPA